MQPFAHGDAASHSRVFNPREGGHDAGSDAAHKLSSENKLDRNSLQVLQFAESGFRTAANPQVAEMLNGFSLGGGDNEQGDAARRGPLEDLNSFARGDGAQMAASVLADIFQGLKDVGAGFASQDQPIPDDENVDTTGPRDDQYS